MDKDIATQPGISHSGKIQLPPPLPKNIGSFSIEYLLAEGVISLVYLGFLENNSTPYAIKTLNPSFLHNPEALRRFKNEAEILKSAHHPNIASYIENGIEGDLPYIAMEFIEGISLRQYLRINSLSLKSALEILLDIAYAVCHLHTLEIIHRDLKPENILITENKGVKLIDFGISKQVLKKEDLTPTQSKMVMGTPFYMSPEQRKDADSVSLVSDIYSLGIIGYELILGNRSKGKIHIGLLPRGLQKIIAKALQENPSERYTDILSFIADLTEFLNSKELEREQKTQDVIHVFSENLLNLQGMFLPDATPPLFKGLEVGLSYQKGLIPTGFLSEFLYLQKDIFGALFAKTDTESPKGIFELAFLKGLIKAFSSFLTDPSEIAILLNQFIVDETKTKPLSFCLLIINPETSTFSFLSCGYGNLFLLKKNPSELIKIKNEHPLLGEHKDTIFTPTIETWEQGDILLFNNLTESSSYEDLFSEKKPPTSNEKNPFSLPPQELSAKLLRKAKILHKESFIKKTPEVLITLQKK